MKAKSIKSNLTDLLASLPSVAILAFTGILGGISYSSCIFSGALLQYSQISLAIALLGCFSLSLVTSLHKSNMSCIGAPQPEAAAVLGLATSKVLIILQGRVPEEEILSTIIMVLSFTSAFTGIFLYVLGNFKLGNLARFLPYSVIGGFLGGVGWLVMEGGLSLMTKDKIPYRDPLSLLESSILMKWLPGIAFGFLLWYSIRHFKHFAVFPVLILTFFSCFYLLSTFLGFDFQSLQEGSWLLEPVKEEGLSLPITRILQHPIHYEVLLDIYPEIITSSVMTLIPLLLTMSSLEISLKKDIDNNRELKIGGFANLINSVIGMSPGFRSLSMGVLTHQLGAPGRFTGIFTALLSILLFSFGSQLFSYLPRMLIGGFLFSVGWSFFYEWFFEAYKKMTIVDYLVVLSVMFFSVIVGFMEAILMGVFLSIVFFVINYSRIHIVKYKATLKNLRSNVDRSRKNLNILGSCGDEVEILSLQNYIFFATVNTLLKEAKVRLEDKESGKLRILLLDFRNVIGMDASAAISLMKLLNLADEFTFHLYFSSLPPSIENSLIQNGLSPDEHEHIFFFDDLDHALEHAEECVIKKHNPEIRKNVFLKEQLLKIFPDNDSVEALIQCMKRGDIKKGEHLIRQGEQSKSMYFIESGELSIELEIEGKKPLRLRKIQKGTLVGEIAFYLNKPRSASIIAESDCRYYEVTLKDLESMESSMPNASNLLHNFVARTLSERIVDMNNVVSNFFGEKTLYYANRERAE